MALESETAVIAVISNVPNMPGHVDTLPWDAATLPIVASAKALFIVALLEAR